jgi:hypothetical protein
LEIAWIQGLPVFCFLNFNGIGSIERENIIQNITNSSRTYLCYILISSINLKNLSSFIEQVEAFKQPYNIHRVAPLHLKWIIFTVIIL